MAVWKWDVFADHVISELAGAREGESALIVADTATDDEISRAFLSAALRRGMDASLLVSRAKAALPTPPAVSLTAAVEQVDLVLGLTDSPFFMHSPAARRARSEHGTRFLMTDATMGEYLYDGVMNIDYPRMLGDMERFGELLKDAHQVHVEDGFGTSVDFDVTDRPVLNTPGKVSSPGEVEYYPGAQVSIAPIEESINGVIVADASIAGEGRLLEPARLTIEKGRITEVTGGSQAIHWSNWLAGTDEENIYCLCHFSVGFNPRARITGRLMEDERLVGGVDFGFGAQDPKFGGTVGPCRNHTDIMLSAASIYFDGVQISEPNQYKPELGFKGA